MRSTTKAVAVKMRLGVYDLLDDNEPIHFIGRIYDGNDDEQEILCDTIREYNAAVASEPGCSLAMSVFRWEDSGHSSGQAT